MIYRHDFGNSQALRAHCRQRGLAMAPTLMVGFITIPTLTLVQPAGNNTAHLTARQFLGLAQAEFIKLAPRLVLSPLIEGGHDALEFALKLDRLGYIGRYRALVRHLPNISLVANEVRSAAPSINFGVTELGPLGIVAAYAEGEGFNPDWPE